MRDKAEYLEYVAQLPVNAAPEVFGLHENADITCAQNDTYTMFATILSLQPRAASGGGKSRDELLDEAAADILAKMPQPFNLEAVTDAYPTMYEESMNTVLQQECIRYNKLIEQVLKTLADVRKALKGEVVMTSELEEMGTSLFNNQVPEMWSKVAMPSLKPLATWVPDLCARLAFLQTWIDNGVPVAYWVGLLLPAGLPHRDDAEPRAQVPAADRHDLVVVRVPQALGRRGRGGVEAPTDGAYVHGLFLEGARWDAESALLQESRSKELFTQLPVLHLLPPPTARSPRAGSTSARLQDARALRHAVDDGPLDQLCDGVRDPLRPTAGALDQAGSRGDHGAKILVRIEKCK